MSASITNRAVSWNCKYYKVKTLRPKSAFFYAHIERLLPTKTKGVMEKPISVVAHEKSNTLFHFVESGGKELGCLRLHITYIHRISCFFTFGIALKTFKASHHPTCSAISWALEAKLGPFCCQLAGMKDRNYTGNWPTHPITCQCSQSVNRFAATDIKRLSEDQMTE